MKKAVVFGDGTPLPDEAMEALVKYYGEHACKYKWEAGKFVIVDNSVACHSREVFKGERKTIVIAHFEMSNLISTSWKLLRVYLCYQRIIEWQD